MHLSYATRDPVAWALAQRLRTALGEHQIPVTTSAQPFDRARTVALVLLLTPSWWAEDAVQERAHAEHVRREREVLTGPDPATVPIVPVRVLGAWAEVAPDELRHAGFFDAERPEDVDELIGVLLDLARSA